MRLRNGPVEATDPTAVFILRQIFPLSTSTVAQIIPGEYRLHHSIFKMPTCNSVLEFGTYHGTGTTRMVLDALPKLVRRMPYQIPFYTCEANYNNYTIAKANLKKAAPWVNVKHGTSLYFQEMIDFIEKDDVLLCHENYPDIYIDAADPVPFYRDEILGQLSCFGKGAPPKEGLLYKLIPEVTKAKRVPLFMLDSAGGVGFLEYQRVVDIMDEKPFYVWVHDVNHLKHFRSLGHMKHAANTKILWETEEWALGAFNCNPR